MKSSRTHFQLTHLQLILIPLLFLVGRYDHDFVKLVVRPNTSTAVGRQIDHPKIRKMWRKLHMHDVQKDGKLLRYRMYAKIV